MMEWMAGKATPSPSPIATRMSSSMGTPSAAAPGVSAVVRLHAVTPSASTPLPPCASASAPPSSCGSTGGRGERAACGAGARGTRCARPRHHRWWAGAPPQHALVAPPQPPMAARPALPGGSTARRGAPPPPPIAPPPPLLADLGAQVPGEEGRQHHALLALVPPKLVGHGDDGGADVAAIRVADEHADGRQAHLRAHEGVVVWLGGQAGSGGPRGLQYVFQAACMVGQAPPCAPLTTHGHEVRLAAAGACGDAAGSASTSVPLSSPMCARRRVPLLLPDGVPPGLLASCTKVRWSPATCGGRTAGGRSGVPAPTWRVASAHLLLPAAAAAAAPAGCAGSSEGREVGRGLAIQPTYS